MAPWVGLGAAVLLVVTAVALPRLADWQVYSHGTPSPEDLPPLHARWAPKLGAGTVPALVIAVLAWRYACA